MPYITVGGVAEPIHVYAAKFQPATCFNKDSKDVP